MAACYAKPVKRLPLLESKSPLRGVLDLATFAYPRFVWGGGIGACLPVFHFHGVTPSYLEPYLRYLAENGYRAVTSEAVLRYVRDGVSPGPKAVVLCFDDAWASLWTVGMPLLRKHGLTAITFAIPGRVVDAATTRATMDDPGWRDDEPDASLVSFATWPELRAMQASGVIDVQSHTHAHAKIDADPTITGFVRPDDATHIHDRPLLTPDPVPRFVDATLAGAPRHPVRSRMSDARWVRDDSARDACVAHVAANGGAEFFHRDGWESELRAVAARSSAPRIESDAERDAAILADLARSREELNARLGVDTVRHICFPWAVAGGSAEAAAKRAGYVSAYADRLGGLHAVTPGQNPFRMMRLKHDYIYALPGGGRRAMWPRLLRGG